MRVHLDPHTGQTLTPEQVPAYLTHPANHGRCVQLVPLLTFDSARANVPPGAGRADSPPTQSPHGSPAAAPGRGFAPALGATSHKSTPNPTHN